MVGDGLVTTERVDPATALWLGVKETWFVVDRTLAYIGGVFTGREAADQVAALPRPLLIGLDVDGVLAPIVAHPDQSALTAGILDVLASISSQPGVHVAVGSGRTVADLARFEFPNTVDLVGSHGMETAENELRPLDTAEHDRLDALRQLAIVAAEAAGHHPDIDIRWRTVKFVLSTHDQGGLTQLDVELAHQITQAAGRVGAVSRG